MSGPLVVAVGFTLVFAATNGVHDAANAVATLWVPKTALLR
jgi:phosphate/sulfate permease